MSTDFSQDVPFDPFTMDDVDPDKPGSAGGQKLPEGGYRMIINEVVVQNAKGSTEVKCEVTNAKDISLVGRPHTEYLKWPKAEYQETGNRIAKEHLLAWCYAAKTTSAEEIRARQRAHQGFAAKWLEAMVGRDVLCWVKAEEYEGRPQAKIEGRVWAVDNPKGKGIPGYVGPAASPAAGSSGGPATTAPQQPAAAAAPATDPFAGLV